MRGRRDLGGGGTHRTLRQETGEFRFRSLGLEFIGFLGFLGFIGFMGSSAGPETLWSSCRPAFLDISGWVTNTLAASQTRNCPAAPWPGGVWGLGV